MVLERNPTIVIAALAVSILGLVLHVTGFASTNWWSLTAFGTTYHGGLWKTCAPTCVDAKGDNASSAQLAAQAMGTIGLLVCVGGIIVIILKRFVMKDNALMKHGYAIAIGLLAAAAIFILIEIAVFIGESNDTVRENLKWSFGLDVAGLILIVISAVLIVIPTSG